MLENLIGDHNVELPVQSFRANVKFRKLRRGVGSEFECAPPLRAARDFQDIQRARVACREKFEAAAVHNDPDPIGRIKPNPFQRMPDPSSKAFIGQQRFGKSSNTHLINRDAL